MEQSCTTDSLDNSLNEDGFICQMCSPFIYEPNEIKFYQHLIMSHFKEKLTIRYGIQVYNTVHSCEGCEEKFKEADLFLLHCALTHDKAFIKKLHDNETMTKSDYEDLQSENKNKHPNKEIEVIDQWNEQQKGYKSVTPRTKKRSNVDNVTISYPCTNSLKNFPESSKPEQTPLKQTEMNGFSCNVCNKSFTKKLGLILHKCSGVAISYSSSYSCSDCLETFPTPSQLESHKLFHVELKAFLCLICFKDFNQKSYLEEHTCEQKAEERFDVSHLCTTIMD